MRRGGPYSAPGPAARARGDLYALHCRQPDLHAGACHHRPGLSARGHGVLTNGYRLDPELPTFMNLLQEGGYRTGVAGKVHVRPLFAGLFPDYTRYGFDVAHVTEDARGGEWLDWVAEHHPQHYDAELATIWPTGIPELAAYGPRRENLQGARIEAIRATFQWATPEHPHNNPGAYTLPFPAEVSQTEWITGHGVEFNNISTATPRNGARSVRTPSWRYTRYPNGAGEQLFHLTDDPDEQRNQAADPAHAAVRHELRDRLLDLIVLQDYPHTHRDLLALGVH